MRAIIVSLFMLISLTVKSQDKFMGLSKDSLITEMVKDFPTAMYEGEVEDNGKNYASFYFLGTTQQENVMFHFYLTSLDKICYKMILVMGKARMNSTISDFNIKYLKVTDVSWITKDKKYKLVLESLLSGKLEI